jgi:hypothetical protein
MELLMDFIQFECFIAFSLDRNSDDFISLGVERIAVSLGGACQSEV